ncbi:MAG: non-heme iron oxygenase ferredoxin subunit [Chloroflexi bacterium]|nr:non-heme iron oxygenase ferredoxin subunit [Chloroflexota bacterium]
MPTFITVAKLGEVPPGKMKTFVVNSKRVLIANVQGNFFATQDLCTHDNGPLGDGELFGEEVECPRHGARFNVQTGKATQMPAIMPIKTFPVQVNGDDIQVAFG